jgi:hypothetical protein
MRFPILGIAGHQERVTDDYRANQLGSLSVYAASEEEYP